MGEQALEEVCPSCGDYVTYIAPSTGWCFTCTFNQPEDDSEGGVKCTNCDRPTDKSHKLCRTCRHNSFLEKHGDEIDLCLAMGASLTRALQMIRQNEQIQCKSCGGLMRKASNGNNYFCTKKQECRTAQRKLKYFIYEKGMARNEALSKVLEAIQ